MMPKKKWKSWEEATKRTALDRRDLKGMKGGAAVMGTIGALAGGMGGAGGGPLGIAAGAALGATAMGAAGAALTSSMEGANARHYKRHEAKKATYKAESAQRWPENTKPRTVIRGKEGGYIRRVSPEGQKWLFPEQKGIGRK